MDADEVMHELDMLRRDHAREIADLGQQIQDLKQLVADLRNAYQYYAAP